MFQYVYIINNFFYMSAIKPIDVSHYESYKSLAYPSAIQRIRREIREAVKFKIWDIMFTMAVRLETACKKIEVCRPKNNAEKYWELKILMLSTLLPDDVEKTYSWISAFYPNLSKRQIAKIQLEIEWNFPTWRNNIRWIDDYNMQREHKGVDL